MKTEIKKTIEAIKEYLTSLSNHDLIYLNNDYCEQLNYNDDIIYVNDEEFFEIFFDGKVLDAVKAVNYGNFNYSDNYVKFNGYGNLESFNYFDGNIIDDIANAILNGEFTPYNIELIEEEA